MASLKDQNYMKAALSFARRGVGRTAPNPSVGCVIVKGDHVVGRGRTAEKGRPHAEAIALEQAGENAKDATAYITLEPCAVDGRAHACAPALVKAGIKRAVVACLDENPFVYKKGIRILEEAGIEVTLGVCEQKAKEMHRGFFLRHAEKRPSVTLKCACTLDGKIALVNGESQWITSDLSRRHVHHLRAHHDAILVGANTAIHDNPMLTSRLDGVQHNLTRIVMDRHLRLDIDSKLVQTADKIPLLVLYESGNPEPLTRQNVKAHKIECSDLVSVLEYLASQGINNLLIEGGAKVHASFLKAGMFDELVLYRAPTILGEGSKSVVSDMNIDTLMSRLDLVRTEVRYIGDDLLERYKKDR